MTGDESSTLRLFLLGLIVICVASDSRLILPVSALSVSASARDVNVTTNSSHPAAEAIEFNVVVFGSTFTSVPDVTSKTTLLSSTATTLSTTTITTTTAAAATTTTQRATTATTLDVINVTFLNNISTSSVNGSNVDATTLKATDANLSLLEKGEHHTYGFSSDVK